MRILRELGMEPFVGWARRPRGLRMADVARKLDVGVQRVKDRVARMTEDGVITGYRLLPNLRHCGQGLTVYHLQDATVPDERRMAGLADVDGFARVVWFLDAGLCINLSHASDAQRRRRIQVLGRLVHDERPAKVLYTLEFPAVDHPLTDLDWRLVRALHADAKRPARDVTRELGVSTKTVRTRLNRMRDEGSIDEYAALDFSKMAGVVPFQLAVWAPWSLEGALLERFGDRYLAHFVPPGEQAYCPLLLRIFAYTPAEVQALVREALELDGVERAEAMVATGGWDNPAWTAELIDAHTPMTVP